MQKSLYVFVLILLPYYLSAQQIIRQFVKGNTVPIAAIHPDSLDFSDLEPIGKAIGDARIVMLGEQSHGDGATFLAKARLIKYLYEKKGFNVLAFESDFFALNHGWDQLEKQEEAIRNFIPRNIFTIWTNAEQLKEFFYSYIPARYKTSDPLILTGFDCQLGQWHSRNALKSYLDAYLKENNVAFCHSPEYADDFFPFLDSLTRYAPSRDISKLRRFEQFTDTILRQLRDKAGDDFGMMLLNNLKEFSRVLQYGDTDFYKSFVIRDAQMAQNLNWLAKTKFPDEKIIVWAASGHIRKSKFEGADKTNGRKIVTPMGKFFTDSEANRAQTYVLGFTSGTGKFGNLGHEIRSVPWPSKGSFETWIKKRYDYAFVDFKSFNEQYPGLSEPFSMKGRGHWSTRHPWNQAFDGVFYIRHMFPPEANEDARRRLRVDSISWGLAGFNITETKAFRKRKVRFTASVRLEGSKENKAFLRLWVNGEVKEYIQIKPGDWSKYEIVGLVGKNPGEIKFDVSVIKGGAVLYIDDVTWYVEKNKKWRALTSTNDFETVQPGEIPKGWYVNGKNYMTGVTEEAAFSGTKSICVKIPAGK